MICSTTPVASRWKFGNIVLLGTLSLLTLAVFFRGSRESEMENVQTSPMLDALDSAAVAAQTQRAERVDALENVHALIVPHHVPPAGQLIANTLAAARKGKPHTIVIIGPDHPDRGSTLFTTSANHWSAGEKTYEVNDKIVRTLQKLDMVSVNDTLIQEEHSVLTPLPYTAARFPNTKFVLLTVRSAFNYSELEQMARTLDAALGPDDVVVASVDFSHYKPLQEAQKDDAKSIALLQAMDPARLKDIPADSPCSLAVAMRFAMLRGSQTLTILEQSNSALLFGDPALQSTTSYIMAAMH